MSFTVMNDEESVELALLTSDKLLSPDDFMRLLAVEDPDRLLPRFWANIDCGAPMIVDAATLTCLGYAGTVRIKKQNFRMKSNKKLTKLYPRSSRNCNGWYGPDRTCKLKQRQNARNNGP